MTNTETKKLLEKIFNCNADDYKLNNDVKVKPCKREGASYLTVYIPQDTERDASYTVFLNEWDENKIIQLLNKIMHLKAEEVEAAFVYDGITEKGIFKSLALAKAGQIGWMKKGRNESYAYIRNSEELAAFLVKEGAFDEDIADIPSIFFTCTNYKELGDKLIDGDGKVVYLLEADIKDSTEHIHKYEAGCYYKCNGRILYKID